MLKHLENMTRKFVGQILRIMLLVPAIILAAFGWGVADTKGELWISMGLGALVVLLAVSLWLIMARLADQASLVDQWMRTQDELTRKTLDVVEDLSAACRMKVRPARKHYRNPNSPEFGGIKNDAK